MLVEHSLNLLAITLLELTAPTGRLEDVADSEASLHLSVVFLHFEHRPKVNSGATSGVFAPYEFELGAR